MATKRRRRDTLASIVVGHCYVKHVNIACGNIRASRNTPTLTEWAPATSRQVTSWHRVIGWLALAVQYRWRRVRFHWPDRVGCRASFTVYVAKVPQKRWPFSYLTRLKKSRSWDVAEKPRDALYQIESKHALYQLKFCQLLQTNVRNDSSFI